MRAANYCKGVKTERQWNLAGYKVKSGCDGERMWTNRFCGQIATYFGETEVEVMNPDEKAAWLESDRLRRNKMARESRKKRIEREKRIKERLKREEEEWLREKEAQEQERIRVDAAIKSMNEKLANALELPAVPCDNSSKVVVYDTETTGLSSKYDEILQFSACDGYGNELLSTLIRPYYSTSWDDAQGIHGISPEMVADAPYFHELIPRIKGIFDSANLLVTYNGIFDAEFLQKYGIDVMHIPEYDVMREFAPIYGEWNDYFENFKWQKLTTCAAYYGYEFKAHDALEDVRATLHCWKRMFKHKTLEERAAEYDGNLMVGGEYDWGDGNE